MVLDINNWYEGWNSPHLISDISQFNGLLKLEI